MPVGRHKLTPLRSTNSDHLTQFNGDTVDCGGTFQILPPRLNSNVNCDEITNVGATGESTRTSEKWEDVPDGQLSSWVLGILCVVITVIMKSNKIPSKEE